MNRAQAQAINIGDGVTFGGHVYTVASIKTSGIAAPYFRLAQGPGHGLVSYELCGRVISKVAVECDSCAENGTHGVPAVGHSVNPDWSGYDLCQECIDEYNQRAAINNIGAIDKKEAS